MSELENRSRPKTEEELNAILREAYDHVNRSIAGHGGKISIVDVRDGNLFIAMSGGCQGCAASQITLRQGFEVMVRKVAPEIVDVVDTTDHEAGTKPFYERTGTGGLGLADAKLLPAGRREVLDA